MFGCGEFSDIEMLLYIEGSADSNLSSRIENHLTNCSDCLTEVMEQSRIQARMDAGKPEAMSLPVLLSVKIKNRILAGVQAWGMETYEPNFQAVRNATKGVGARLFNSDFSVVLIPDQNGRVNLEIHTGEMLDYDLRLQGKSIESGRLEAGVNRIENLKSGIYTLKVSNQTLLIRLEEE